MSSSRAFPGGGGSRGQDGGYQSFGDNNSSAPPTPLPPASSSSGVGGQPTYAAFSPPSLGKNQSSSGSASAASKRSTILVHQKSPLLLATPPQITRALAYSHPFILPLNTVAGLLSWTTGDPWESFLLVCAFWALVLYGDVVIRLAGPVVVVLVLIAGMYSRRWSPLSSRSYEVSREAAIAVGDKASKSGKGDAATDDGKLGHRRGASMAAGTGAQGEKDRDGGGSQAKEAKTSSHTRTLSNLASTAASAANPAEATPTRHQKTLDSMVATLKEFTHRCGLLLEPLLELTDFLSTQRTPTTASTRPALTTLFIRILFCTPVWIILTLPPWRIITTRRVVLFVGTVALTWHARAMRVARTIVWRSLTVRRLAALVTGLEFEMPKAPGSGSAGGPNEKDGVAADKLAAGSSSAASAKAAASGSTTSAAESELTKALRRRDRKSHSRMGSGASNGDGTRDSGVRFTFIIYENQRRWVGLGWTSSLFAYERPAWTDEHNNPVPPRDDFELPSPADTHVGGAGGKMRWRWVRGSRWKVDGVPDAPDGSGNQVDVDGEQGRMGWIYYDNKWQNGRRGQDGWGRWTRRRKWYRDAELVEVDDSSDEDEPSHTPPSTATVTSTQPHTEPPMMAVSPSAPNFPASSVGGDASTADMPNTKTSETASSGGGADDAASLLSSSSRSARFFKASPAPPTLTTGSGTEPAASDMRSRTGSIRSRGRADSSQLGQGRARRTSEAAAGNPVGENEAAPSLDPALELEIQGSGREGGKWGIGDEARMGLE